MYDIGVVSCGKRGEINAHGCISVGCVSFSDIDLVYHKDAHDRSGMHVIYEFMR